MGSEEKLLPYYDVDKTVDAASHAALFKVLQPPGRLFFAGVAAGWLIGMGFWLAFMTGGSLFPLRVEVVDGHPVFKHVGAVLGVKVAEEYHIDLLTISKLIIGAVFPLGLISILLGGADLWTGNVQAVIYPYARKFIDLRGVLYNWIASYAGNFIGGLFLAFMATYGTLMLVKSPFFDTVYTYAYKKSHLDAWTAFWRGVGCNILVNLAVWLYFRAKGKDMMGQAFLIWFPIFAFVAIGFEHSIANMFCIPAGIFASAYKWHVYTITYREYFFNNLLPVTYGNAVGPLILITLYYWYVGSIKGSALGEAKPSDALKLVIDTCIIVSLIHLVLLVVIPGAIAVGVEAALGLAPGVHVDNPYIALVPGIIASIYYIAITFIMFKVLRPYTSVKISV